MRDPRRIVVLALATLSCLAQAAAQEAPFAPTEAEVDSWLKATAASLKTHTEPDNTLLDIQYFGLRRFSKNVPEDVGYEVYKTSFVLHHGKKVYRFDDRAVLVTPEGDTVRVFSTGLADASFNGIRSTLHLVVTGKHPADLTVTAIRTGETIEVTFSRDAKDAAADKAVPQTLRLNTAGRPVALSGELQRLTRITHWKTGDVLAFWHLDAVNGNLDPVVLRAMKEEEPFTRASVPYGPVRIEAWAAQVGQPGLALQSTTHFLLGSERPEPIMYTYTVKPDGLTKCGIPKSVFEKDWAGKFEDGG